MLTGNGKKETSSIFFIGANKGVVILRRLKVSLITLTNRAYSVNIIL